MSDAKLESQAFYRATLNSELYRTAGVSANGTEQKDDLTAVVLKRNADLSN